MDTMLLDPFVRMLDDACTPRAIRDVEAGRGIDAMWATIAASGFLDALVPEAKGGAGLIFDQVTPLVFATGSHAVPLPVAETIVGRGLLGLDASAIPDGPLVLADFGDRGGGLIPSAAVATHIVADMGDRLCLFRADTLTVRPSGVHGSLSATISGGARSSAITEAERPAAGIRSVAAIIRAAQIAGAAHRVLEMTTAYAGERIQFGKPIGKQQAIQQTLAVMAEQSVMARMAAHIGCAEALAPRIEIAAIAKQVASAAAVEIANIAHAVHGAIGISEEFDLQLYTRRLHEWRMADGSEGFWGPILGRMRLESSESGSVDYIRSIEPS